MSIISQPLAVIAKSVDVILMGELIDAKTTFYSYEYGASSKAWDETILTFSVKECLKGAWKDQIGSGTYYPPSFSDDVSEGPQSKIVVINGSGIESDLRSSERYLFFLETRNGTNTIIRVEPETMRNTLQALL